MSSEILIVDQANGVYTLTLNRPDQFNALSKELLAELQQKLDTIAHDERARCVVLAANGRAFCAGHDLKQMRAHPEYGYQAELFADCSRMMEAIVDLPVPVVARVQGIATAAGCQLVASCDLAVAVNTARFAVSGINVGLFCGTPAVALTRNVPIKKAFEMLVTGRFISADEAVTNGLINQAVEPAQLDGAVAALVAAICSKSPVAIRTGKSMYRRQHEMSLADAYAYANRIMAGGMMAADAHEGIDAFKEKRVPVWTGM